MNDEFRGKEIKNHGMGPSEILLMDLINGAKDIKTMAFEEEILHLKH